MFKIGDKAVFHNHSKTYGLSYAFNDADIVQIIGVDNPTNPQMFDAKRLSDGRISERLFKDRFTLYVEGEKAMEKKFWIIWNPLSKTPPTQKFYSKDQANKVAENMAKKHNEKFYVLEVVGSAKTVEVVYTEIK